MTHPLRFIVLRTGNQFAVNCARIFLQKSFVSLSLNRPL
jgi:hypothetical protein